MAVIEQLRQLDEVEPLSTDVDGDPGRCRRADAGASAEPAAEDALRDRPVRAEGRQGAGLRRSVFGNAGVAAESAQPAGLADRQQPRAAVQGLGRRDAAKGRGRRPPRCAGGRCPGAGPWRPAARLRRLARPPCREPQSQGPDHRRSEPDHDGYGRHPRAAARGQDDVRAADLDLARFGRDPGRQGPGHARRRRPPRRLQARRQALHAGRPRHRHGRDRLPGRPAESAGRSQAGAQAEPPPDRRQSRPPRPPGSNSRCSRSMSWSSPTPTCSTTASGCRARISSAGR